MILTINSNLEFHPSACGLLISLFLLTCDTKKTLHSVFYLNTIFSTCNKSLIFILSLKLVVNLEGRFLTKYLCDALKQFQTIQVTDILILVNAVKQALRCQ